MQPASLTVPQPPTVTSLLQLLLQATSGLANQAAEPAGFAEALGKLLAAGQSSDGSLGGPEQTTPAPADAAADPSVAIVAAQPQPASEPELTPAVLPPAVSPAASKAPGVSGRPRETARGERNATPILSSSVTPPDIATPVLAVPPSAPQIAGPDSGDSDPMLAVPVRQPHDAVAATKPAPVPPGSPRSIQAAPGTTDPVPGAAEFTLMPHGAAASGTTDPVPGAAGSAPLEGQHAALTASAPVLQAGPLDTVTCALPTPAPGAGPQSVPSRDSSPAATSAPHAASPAAQVAPALIQMGHSAGGAQQLTLRLQPPELGQVQVRIERPSDAPARVEITVEKPETLTLLLRDQPQLQHALDLAGVPAEGRSVTFHVVPPEPTPRSEPGTAPSPGVATGGPSGDGSHGAPRQDGHPARHQPGTPDTAERDAVPFALTGWLRGGLDITA